MNEQIVLLTAEGSVWNPRKQQYEKILFVFDTGAQKTVVDENLVKQFGLPKHMTEKSSISGNAGRTETFESHVVALKIDTAFGEEIEMTVQTRPVITNGFPSIRLEQDDVTFLKASDIFLTNTKLRGEIQIPRVLVGLDYYHDLITLSGNRTPSGLHIAKTVFGHAIYGRGLSRVSQPKSVSYNLTAICEETEHQTLQKNPEFDGPMNGQKAGNLPKYSGEIIHAYGFTTSSLPLKEVATDVANNHSVAVRRLQPPQPQPSAANSSRHRPVLHVKPPSTPSSHRSPPTSADRRRPSRHQAVLHNRPRQDVNPRRTTTTWKKAKPSDYSYDYSCRSPEYHRRIDDPYCTHYHHPYRTSCGGGGLTRLMLAMILTSQNDVVSRTRHTLLTFLTIPCTVSLCNKYIH
ncbi:hypothetical protein Y032_0029g1963 [Ancylostoma ceylanicum]|uniref:Peptidase A2 domain-containing protein n=1 Tax=Ancylostoma ceylanicum TaxID=53326 RepID=A0A016USW9_9BILA|nr:hypothetical protein Y032_0029g1963 [Ancylostoma ceylanicum]